MGVHLAGRLLEDGHHVRIYSRTPNRFRPPLPGAEYMEGELGNSGLIRDAVEDVEVVYHFASTTIPKTSNDDPIYDVRSNVVDTLGLLEACVAAGVRKVVFASSGGTVYGPPRMVPISEDHPTDPITSYGIVKLAVEKYLNLFHHLYGLDYAALRISNPYGPYQDPAGQQGAVAVFLHRLHTGRKITIWGDGGVVRDYLYIEDLVEALVLGGVTETRRKVLNVGSGRGVSLKDLISHIFQATDKDTAVEYLPGRALDVPANVLDVERVREELGWIPQTGLSEGLAATWEWVSTFDGGVERRP